jgi:hypothetical protein
MKSCLDPSHIACEKCSPGFNERMAYIDKMRVSTLKILSDAIQAAPGSTDNGEGKPV